MLTVALTGNIASGKSSVAWVWQRLGARVVDADRLAREAVAPGSSALAAIRTEFGDAVLRADGSLDRDAMRDLVFRDDTARARLEAIVHPEVARRRDEEFRAAAADGERLVVADIPLLFEVGMQDQFDVVVVVDAPAEVRETRIVRERGLTRDEARRMIEAQLPAAEKRARADHVIDNAGTPAELEAAAVQVWHELAARAAAQP